MCQESDAVLSDRMKQIQDLSDFISSKHKRLSNVLEKIGWSEDSLKNEKKVKCPFNSGHWIPESSVEEHVKICSSENDFYLREDLEKQPPSCHFFYSNSTSAVPVLLGKEQLTEILSQTGESGQKWGMRKEIQHMPRTMDRYITEFSPQERLAIYDYIVEKGKATNKPVSVTVEDLLFDFEKKTEVDEKPKTKLELLAEERDYKRRRQSYRAKNVHLTKKSYTEVMKEVIENHTNFLSEVLKEEEKSLKESQKKADIQENGLFTDEDKQNEKSVSEKESRKPHHRNSRNSSPDHYHRHHHHHHRHHRHKRSRSHSNSRHKHKKHRKH